MSNACSSTFKPCSHLCLHPRVRTTTSFYLCGSDRYLPAPKPRRDFSMINDLCHARAFVSLAIDQAMTFCVQHIVRNPQAQPPLTPADEDAEEVSHQNVDQLQKLNGGSPENRLRAGGQKAIPCSMRQDRAARLCGVFMAVAPTAPLRCRLQDAPRKGVHL
jgi:hypothetical protein